MAAQLRHEWADRSIAVISDTPGLNHSKSSDKFFAFLNKYYDINVFCNESGGERKIACEGRLFSVDGYVELPANDARAKLNQLVEQFKFDVTDVTDALNKNDVVIKVVIEYQGCYYHGCQLCMDPEADHYGSGLKMAEMRQRSETRTYMISSRGYVVLELRPCVFHKLLGNTPLGKKYHQFRAALPYKHRDALFGGRCENLSRFYKACTCVECSCDGCTAVLKTKNTVCTVCENHVLGLCYVDITSLYPYVLAACPYPVGAPEHLLKPPIENLGEWFGFAQIDILPPKNLFIPVLPIRDVKGRLVFGLCHECINTKEKGNCEHNEEQRIISGIYFTEEIKKAVEFGYVVKAVQQVYHWEKKSVNIFRPYIQHFFEKKMLCDGLTDELKALAPNETGDAQIAAIKKRVKEIAKQLCNIDLKLIEEFKTNKALRFIVKLLLNSLWGRFGMQTDGKKSEFFTEDEAEKVFALMSNPNNEITHFIVCDGPNNSNTICIEYRPKKGATGNEAKVNIPVAAMTTAWARLRIYDIFSAVADPTDIMYYDTDSMVAVESVVPQLTKFMQYPFMLGQLKNELKAGERIIEFWCCGPKSYMYTTNLGHVVHHYEGISLCDEVKEALCSANVAPIVEHHECGEKSDSLLVKQFQIVKTSIVPGNLHARNIQKILQSTNDMKRKWTGTTAITYPYGYDMDVQPRNRGCFVLFEGGDRCGKTTQSKMLMKSLEARQIPAKYYKFPDLASASGQVISRYLKNRQDVDNDADIQQLFLEQRKNLLNEMETLLREGTSLVVDRYAFSGIVYSSLDSAGVDPNQENGLLKPDVVFLVDCDPNIAATRSSYGQDRFEKIDIQQKVRESFSIIMNYYKSAGDGDRWCVLDATTKSAATLHEEVWEKVRDLSEGEIEYLDFTNLGK